MWTEPFGMDLPCPDGWQFPPVLKNGRSLEEATLMVSTARGVTVPDQRTNRVAAVFH